MFGANRGPVDGLAVFRANRGPRPSTENLPHSKLPAMNSKNNILDSIILIQMPFLPVCPWRINGASAHPYEFRRASAHLRLSCFRSRFSRSTGFPPFFSVVFSVVQAQRTILYIWHCFPFKLNLPDQSQHHKTPTACPPHLLS